MTPAQAFAEILDREQSAARQADLASLIEIQNAKRDLIEKLRAESPAGEDVELLAQRARANIGLIRHLVQCLRELASIGSAETYTASGERAAFGWRHQRGAL